MTTLGTHGQADPSSRRCTAHSSRTGEPCKKWAINGTNVCGTHGGKAPQVVAKAQQRLREAADRMAERLLHMAESDKIPSYVALGAINSALDRAGVAEPKDVTVTVKPFESVLTEIQGGSRDAYRRSVGDERAGELPAFDQIENNPQGPGGPRVLGAMPDGSLVIEGELGDDAVSPRAGEPPASMGQGELDGGYPHDDGHDDAQGRRETLANYSPTLNLPNGGYMPTEQAMEQAADANRLSKRNLRRR